MCYRTTLKIKQAQVEDTVLGILHLCENFHKVKFCQGRCSGMQRPNFEIFFMSLFVYKWGHDILHVISFNQWTNECSKMALQCTLSLSLSCLHQQKVPLIFFLWQRDPHTPQFGRIYFVATNAELKTNSASQWSDSLSILLSKRSGTLGLGIKDHVHALQHFIYWQKKE